MKAQIWNFASYTEDQFGNYLVFHKFHNRSRSTILEFCKDPYFKLKCVGYALWKFNGKSL